MNESGDTITPMPIPIRNSADRTEPDLTRARLFTVAAVHSVTLAPAVSIRRWCEGYAYTRRGDRRHSPAKLGPDAGREDGTLLLSFQDMLEIRTARALRKHGVGWSKVIQLNDLLRAQWDAPHPLAIRRLRTDGRNVILTIGERLNDEKVLELGDQFVFDTVLSQSLFEPIDFDSRTPDRAVRLWPIGRSCPILIDPTRAYGRPIIAASGVPVETLVRACAANDNDIEAVARWYDVEPRDVQSALQFEARLRQAA
jgi:uncharacterized protein (DUF433 family)